MCDFLADDGFFPGLRPRGHEAVRHEAACHEAVRHEAVASKVEEFTLGYGGFCDPPRAAELLDHLSRRRLEGRHYRQRSEETPEPVPRAPGVDAEVRRLDDARRQIAAFEAQNFHQAELQALLMRMTDFMRPPGEDPGFEHWWVVVEVYRRVLASPQMASAEARRVLAKLLDLAPGELTERRLEHVLGSRKPKKKSRGRKRRRRLGSRRQRRRHTRIGPQERSPK